MTLIVLDIDSPKKCFLRLMLARDLRFRKFVLAFGNYTDLDLYLDLYIIPELFGLWALYLESEGVSVKRSFPSFWYIG